jgi:ankyrin repeat protein
MYISLINAKIDLIFLLFIKHTKKYIMDKYINKVILYGVIQRLLPIHDDVIGVLKNYIINPFMINKCLIDAADYGYLDAVKYLHQNGADITAFNNLAIKWASMQGHLEIVKYLHQNGVYITASHNFAVRWAAANGYLEVVKYLHENGADVTDENNEAIRWAANNGHLEVVEYLCKNL